MSPVQDPTIHPALGATPPPTGDIAASTVYRPPLPPSRASIIPAYLRRVTYLLSLLLGASGVVAGVYSLLLLPLLRASFAAREALLTTQHDRVGGFVERLRALRAAKLHRGCGVGAREVDVSSVVAADDGEERRAAETKAISDMEEKTTGNSNALSSITDITPTPSPLPDLAPIITALSTLATIRRNTSTTRTSLLSTLEAYTSALHRQMWNPTPSDRWGGVGLNSLDRHLGVAAGGKKAGTYDFEGVMDRSEEWDAVRKEVRAVKGMLLGRRTFAQARER